MSRSSALVRYTSWTHAAQDRMLQWAVGCYALLGLLMWGVPLFNVLHVEAAALVALVSYVISGWAGIRWLSSGVPFRFVLRRLLALLFIPWALLTLTLIWTPNCGYWVGVLFFLLFPCVTVPFSASLAFLLVRYTIRFPVSVHIGLGLLIAIGGVVHDLGFHPQFYTYNHVFGGVLGPIYDEELAIRSGLFVFRAMTLLWAVLFWRLARVTPSRPSLVHAWRDPMLLISGLLLLGCYVNAGRLGINTHASDLERALSGHIQTDHFDIYFEPTMLDSTAQAWIAEYHEFRFAWMEAHLDLDGPDARIQSYLYPDPETKADLSGARYTNVAPVWLSTPQVHVLTSSFERVFSHELAHVFSRPFGLPILNASWSVGLVEGFAQAVEPAAGGPSDDAQVWADAVARTPPGERPDLAQQLSRYLSPLGFWTGRGAVSYTMMASFVRYMLDTYGLGTFERAYPAGDFNAAYKQSVDELAQDWQAHLAAQDYLSLAAGPVAKQRFGRPSIFEKRCPHHIPQYVRHYRRAQEAWAQADTQATLGYLEEVFETYPAYPPALARWAHIELGRAPANIVVARLDTLVDETSQVTLSMLHADALVLDDRNQEAHEHYWALLHREDMDDALRVTTYVRYVLADRRDVMAIRYASLSASEKAAALGRIEDQDAAIRWLQALYLVQAEGYEAAKARFRTTSPVLNDTMPRGMIRRFEWQREQLLAQLYEATDDVDQARTHLQRVETMARRVGHDDLVRLTQDRLAWISWLATHR